MDKNNFTEDDKDKMIEFLNLVAKHAKFEMNTTELIKYFKCLSHMQQVILPKINDNILEIVKVIESEQASDEAEKE